MPEQYPHKEFRTSNLSSASDKCTKLGAPIASLFSPLKTCLRFLYSSLIYFIDFVLCAFTYIGFVFKNCALFVAIFLGAHRLQGVRADALRRHVSMFEALTPRKLDFDIEFLSHSLDSCGGDLCRDGSPSFCSHTSDKYFEKIRSSFGNMPEFQALISDLPPTIGTLVQNFVLCFTGICASKDNVATGVIVTQYLQTLTDKPLYSYFSSALLKIVSRLGCDLMSSHSGGSDFGSSAANYFRLLLDNFRKARGCTDSFSDVCSFLTMAVSTGLVDKIGPSFDSNKMNSLIKLIKPKQFVSRSPVDLVLSTVIGVLTYIGTIFGIDVNPVNDDYEVRFARASAMVEALSAGTFGQHFGDVNRRDVSLQIEMLVSEYTKLVSQSISPMEKSMYGSKLQRLLLLKQKCINIIKNESYVEAAFALLIHGTTSIGKSHLVDIIAKAVGKCANFPVGPENTAVVSPGDKYDTTITPSTTFIICDDVAILRDYTQSEIIRWLIRFINNIPTPALKAAVEEKGTVVINPRLVILTSNVKNLQIPLLATTSIASLRRMFHLHAELLPEYSCDGMLDKSKLEGGDMNATDVWSLTLERAVPCSVSGHKYVVVEANMRIGRCIEVLNKLATKHFAEQRRMVNQKYSSGSLALCDCKSVKILCRKCTPVPSESHSFDLVSRTLSVPRASVVSNYLFSILVKDPICRGVSLYMLNLAGGREALRRKADLMFMILVSLCPFSFYFREYLFGLSVLFVSCLFRTFVSRFVSFADSYRAFVDYYSDGVNYVSIKSGIDAERIKKGITYCSCGVAVLVVIRIMRLYKALRLDAQSEDFDHPDVEVVDDKPYNPWQEAENKARLPRDISVVVTGNPAVHLDQKKKFLRVIKCNSIFMSCSLSRGPDDKVIYRNFHGIRLNSNYILVNRHSISDAVRIKVAGFNTVVDLKEGVYMHFGNDLSLIRWSGGGAVSDLLCYFTDEVVQDGSNLAVHFPDHEDRSGVIHTTLLRKQAIVTARAEFNGYVYMAPSNPGKCGCLVTTSSENRIVGLHAAGQPNGEVSACIPLTRTLIVSMLEKFTSSLFPMLGYKPPPEGSSFLSDGDISPSFDLHSSAISNFAEVGSSAVLHGCFPNGHPLGPRSSPSALVPLTINPYITRSFGPPRKFIPILNGRGGKKSLEVILTKWNSRPPGFTPLQYAKAARELLSSFDGADLSTLRPVSNCQAINGIQSALLCPCINPNTSGGHPFPGTKIRHMVNIPERDGRNCFHLDTFSGKKHEAFARAIRCEDRPYEVPIFTAVMKDEDRPIKSVDPYELKPSRPICVVPMTVVIEFRKYFMMMGRLASVMFDKTGVAIGVNPYGPDFDRIHRKLFVPGNGIVAGDFSSYDTLISADALGCVYGVMYELFRRSGNYTAEDLCAVRHLISLSLNWFVVIDGLLVSVSGANSSGHPLTTLVNCMVNHLFMICAFNECKPPGSLVRYSDVISYAYYGDDNLLSVPPEHQEYFNQITLTETFGQVGIKYTDATKSAAVSKYTTFEEASFLKRTFYDHPDLGCVVGALEIGAIYDSLRYAMRSSISPPRSEASHTAELLDNAVMELFYHGKEVYDYNYAILDSIATELGISNLVKYRQHTYADRVAEWKRNYRRV